MRKLFVAGGAAILVAASAWYWIGTGSLSGARERADKVSAQALADTSRPVLYWQDPDGKPAYSSKSAKTADGRDYVPVHDSSPDDKGSSTKSASGQAAAKNGERKIKYYRNPMGLPDTSPTPKKDSMGMDYIPVYEDEDSDDSSVKISTAKIQRSGVRSEPVQLRHIVRPVRAPGIAQIDERTIRDITLRASGFIDKLYVAETGKHIKAGEPLFRVYSPDIVRAAVDFRVAKEGVGRSPADKEKDIAGAEQRLENFDVPEKLIGELKSGKNPVLTKIDWPSPVGGVVIQKNVIEGQKVDSGTMLYRIADLSKIWVIADVAEQDIGFIKIGAPASVVFRTFPGQPFHGKVTFILPELAMATRTAKVRIEIANPEYRILRDMFADVTINAGDEDKSRLAVPVSAVLDTGVRQVVLVDKGDGRFEPRPVKLGIRGDGYVEVKEGVAEGEQVVTAANFLIDAESNLKAALKSFAPDGAASGSKNAAPDKPPFGNAEETAR